MSLIEGTILLGKTFDIDISFYDYVFFGSLVVCQTFDLRLRAKLVVLLIESFLAKKSISFLSTALFGMSSKFKLEFY